LIGLFKKSRGKREKGLEGHKGEEDVAKGRGTDYEATVNLEKGSSSGFGMGAATKGGWKIEWSGRRMIKLMKGKGTNGTEGRRELSQTG